MTVDDGLRPLIHQHLPHVHWQTIETGAVAAGVPDTNGCIRGIEFWVECKSTDAWAVVMRPAQTGWIARRVRYGGRVHVAVRRRHEGGPRLGQPVDELWLVPGLLVRQLVVGGLRSLDGRPGVTRWAGGPRRWDWPAVLAAMVRPAGAVALTAR